MNITLVILNTLVITVIDMSTYAILLWVVGANWQPFTPAFLAPAFAVLLIAFGVSYGYRHIEDASLGSFFGAATGIIIGLLVIGFGFKLIGDPDGVYQGVDQPQTVLLFVGFVGVSLGIALLPVAILRDRNKQ